MYLQVLLRICYYFQSFETEKISDFETFGEILGPSSESEIFSFTYESYQMSHEKANFREIIAA